MPTLIWVHVLEKRSDARKITETLTSLLLVGVGACCKWWRAEESPHAFTEPNFVWWWWFCCYTDGWHLVGCALCSFISSGIPPTKQPLQVFVQKLDGISCFLWILTVCWAAGNVCFSDTKKVNPFHKKHLFCMWRKKAFSAIFYTIRNVVLINCCNLFGKQKRKFF